ncbi:hypothetical protein VTK56DRAFT_3621 [Thermocarpiscus australiensis]
MANTASQGALPTQLPVSPRFHRIWRQRGDAQPNRVMFSSAIELTTWDGRDLDIIGAPLDRHYGEAENECQTMIDLYNLPADFVS